MIRQRLEEIAETPETIWATRKRGSRHHNSCRWHEKTHRKLDAFLPQKCWDATVSSSQKASICCLEQDGEASRQLFILGLLSFSFLSSTRTLDFCYKEGPKCMCACARKSAHVCTHSICPHAYLIHSHAIKFQTTSTSATRLADVLLVGWKIRGVTYLRSFKLKKKFSPLKCQGEATISAHT